jgi:serine phosphatase RsbU (regulator of sigma subunit)
MNLSPFNSRSSTIEEARLRSESLRIYGMLLILCICTLIALLRLIVPGYWQGEAPAIALIVLLGMVGYELLVLRKVRHAIASGRCIGRSFWLANVIIESLLPAALLLIAIDFGVISPFLMLTGPISYVFFLVTILSTLRLEPLLCRVNGLVGGCAYVGLIVHVFTRHELPTTHEQFIHPISMYWAAAIFIVFAGFLAGFVASQLRKHVEAAIRELEAQQARAQMEHDLDIARSIQQGLLPQTTPDLGDFVIAGWNRPADQTGGDYYDWLMLEDGRFIFSLADVTGHGIGPAIITAVCRAYARATVDVEQNVRDVIIRVNAMLFADTAADRFVTFVLGRLDSEQHHVHLLSAGHGPILYYDAQTKSIRHLDVQGIPLGLFESYAFDPPAEFEMAPGDTLILISDGFFEWAREDGEQFDVTRVEHAILSSVHDGPSAIIERMESDLHAFVGECRQPDDMTAVILQRNFE